MAFDHGRNAERQPGLIVNFTDATKIRTHKKAREGYLTAITCRVRLDNFETCKNGDVEKRICRFESKSNH